MSRLGRIKPWWRRVVRNGYRLDRCEHCGHRFRWSRDARHSFGNRDGKNYHGPCISYLTWRTKADERLDVLGLVMDVSPVTERDIKAAAELRDVPAFRVFYDLKRGDR